MTRLACRHLVTGTDSETGPGVITIRGGLVIDVERGAGGADENLDGWVVPGFVDTHTHGAAGAAFTDPDDDAVLRAINYHRRHGSTSLFASTVSDDLAVVRDQLRSLRAQVAAGELEGVHLEGPFLSEIRKGAHNEDLLIDPELEMVESLLDAGGADLRMITLAPERAGGMRAVRLMTGAGVVAAFGHSDADETCTRKAVDGGITIATHLFNAMRGIHHRQPGPVPWLLTDERVGLELICDGTHVHADVVRMVIESAGAHRVLLVTDAMSATGQPDGDYQLGSLQVVVKGGVARLATYDDSPGAIAGSTLTMDRAVHFVVNEVGVDIPTASMMASTAPARWHRLNDVGLLTAGCRADLCVLDDDAHLQRVMRKGKWLS